MFRNIATLVILGGELILLFFAWKGWITSVRSELPQWRNALCSVALLVLSLNWCGAALLAVLLLTHRDVSGLEALSGMMITLSRPLDVTATIFAMALKRYSRVGAVLAGLLMLAGWPLGYA